MPCPGCSCALLFQDLHVMFVTTTSTYNIGVRSQKNLRPETDLNPLFSSATVVISMLHMISGPGFEIVLETRPYFAVLFCDFCPGLAVSVPDYIHVHVTHLLFQRKEEERGVRWHRSGEPYDTGEVKANTTSGLS